MFLQNGLALGIWMSAACVVGVWIWRTKAIRRLCHLPVSWLFVVLATTTVLCRSLGALALLTGGVGALFSAKWFQTRFFLVCLFIVPVAYCSARILTDWSGSDIVLIAEMVDKARARSLQTRLDNEIILIDRALQQPVFGWGQWGRSRVYDQFGKDVSITDGLWIIVLGTSGLVGLLSLGCVYVLPPLLLVFSVPRTELLSPSMAGALTLGVVVALSSIDHLLNGMPNPIIVLAAGGIMGLCWPLGSFKGHSGPMGSAHRITAHTGTSRS